LACGGITRHAAPPTLRVDTLAAASVVVLDGLPLARLLL
jgi:hypothetical protein